MNDIWVGDLEGDGLDPNVIHCLVATKDGRTFKKLTDYREIEEFLNSIDHIVIHNGIRFDARVIRKLIGIDIESKVIDSLPISWYLFPDRLKHGLEEWGEEFGVPKPVIEDWSTLSVEEYLHRCTEDVKINWKLWVRQRQYLTEIYGTWEKAGSLIRYLNFKMYCARLQEESRWKIDRQFCLDSLQVLEPKRDEKRIELEAVMPKVPDYVKREPPKRPFKSDGSLSVTGEKWKLLTEANDLPFEHSEPIREVKGYSEPNAASGLQLKNWLFSLGWEPQTFKFKKDKKTGELTKIPQISKPPQDGGGLCPSVKNLFEIEPNLERLEGFFVLNHRISILNGFLENEDSEGYVKARISGLTNTLRMKHTEVVNLPKVSAAYGEYLRGALVAPEGYELCGSDMSSLEDRLKQHFMYFYDPDYVDQMNVADFDPHIDLAVMAGMISKEDGDLYKWFKSLNKGESSTVGDNTLAAVKSIGKVRGISKNGNYACQYGAGPPRLVLTTGISLQKAKELHQAYWARNWAVKAAAKDQHYKVVKGQMWLFNPISKLWYSLRYEKDIFSTLVQGSASFCFDMWLGFVLRQRPQLTGQFHDEFILCVKQGHRKDCEALLRECLETTNEILNLNRRLDIDVQFGSRYSEIH